MALTLPPSPNRSPVLGPHSGPSNDWQKWFNNLQTIVANGLASLSFTEITDTSVNMAKNSGYIANNAAQVELLLPSNCPVGNIVWICGKGAGGWRVTQSAGQQIFYTGVGSTVGVTGYLQSAGPDNTVQLICIVADTTFNVLSHEGMLVLN